MKRRSPRERLSLWLFATVLCGSAVFMSGTVRSSDAGAMLEVTRSLAREGSFAVLDHTQGKFGLDGRRYTYYGPACSFAALPLFLLGHGAGRALGLDPNTQERIEQLAVSFFNPLVIALSAVLLLLAAREVGLSPRWAAAGGLLYAFATGIFVQMKDFNSEPLSALLVLVGVWGSLRWARSGELRWPLLVGAIGGLLVLTRVANAVFLPVFGVYLLAAGLSSGGLRRGLGAAVLFALPVLAGIGLYGAYNYARFGDPFDTGYHEVSFTYPLLTGLWYQLFSLERGLLWYNPLVLLSLPGLVLLWRRRPAPTALLLALSAACVLLYATYAQAPGGGQSAGQRFLLVIMPCLVLLALPAAEAARARWSRGLVAGLIGLSVLVQLPLVWVNPSYYYARMIYEQDPTGEDRAPRTAANTILLRSWPLAVEVTREALLYPDRLRALPVSFRPEPSPAEMARGTRAFRVPYLWWTLAWFHGVPGAAVLLGLLLSLALAGGCAWRLGQAWPRGPTEAA